MSGEFSVEVVVEVGDGGHITVACSRPGRVQVVDIGAIKQGYEEYCTYSDLGRIVDLEDETQERVKRSRILDL